MTMLDDSGPPLRGLCHECEVEVVPRELEGEEFECPRCKGACVECPYEDFERWAGVWHVSYADGYENQLTIDEEGKASLLHLAAGHAADDVNTAQLVWAPLDHEGFQMRLQGHFAPGVVEYLCMDPAVDADAISIRHHGLHATVMGRAQRVDDESDDQEDEAVRMDDTEFDFERALDRGFEMMATQFPQGADAAQLQQQLRQLSAPIATMMRNNTALQDQLRTITQQLRNGSLGAATGAGPPFGAFHFGSAAPLGTAGAAGAPQLQEFVFDLSQIFAPQVEPARQSGVPEAVASSWLDSRNLGSTDDLEQDWQCPICFDSTKEQLAVVCEDSSGKALHVFHRVCVKDWLIRRDECPSCRRTPVVRAGASAEPHHE